MARLTRRGFFSMLAAVVALPWVGRKVWRDASGKGRHAVGTLKPAHQKCKICGCLVPVEAPGLLYWNHWKKGFCGPGCAIEYYEVNPQGVFTISEARALRGLRNFI